MIQKARANLVYNVTVAFVSLVCTSHPARAQQVAPATAPPLITGGLQEVTVTARRRKERLQNVPVNIAAVTGGTLAKLQITQLSQLPSLVPGLVVGHSVGSVGTVLAIHGIGETSLDSGVPSSVALIIDGLPMEQGLSFQSALFDLSEIQVLKGPQALFFGKSSPGGVISVTTADPTDKHEVIASEAYNFGSAGPQTELILSGPVTDTLKLRLASMFSRQEGYFHNAPTPDVAAGALGAFSSRAPGSKDWVARGTALWNPTGHFTARLKVNLVGDYATDAETAEYTSCPQGRYAPFGIPFMGNANCDVSSTLHLVNYNPADFPGVPNGGEGYVSTDQRFGTLELDEQLSPELDLISVTGFYHLASSVMSNVYESSSAPPVLAAPSRFRRQDITEELRMTSDFPEPVNFTAGAFFQKASFGNYSNLIGDLALGLPAELGQMGTPVQIEAHSVYGQVRWAIVPQLELAGGLRWSIENRSETAFNDLTRSPITVLDPAIRSNVTSPEITLTYKPTDDITAYAAWKKGYLSGSYSVQAPTVVNNTIDNGFGDEFVKGEEAGIKARLMDDHLAINLTAYDYLYTGLQVGVVPTAVTEVSVVTVNAGAARTAGIDLDAHYRPRGLEALTLNATVGWDHAVYTDLTNVPCWGGQTIAQGCTLDYDSVTGLNRAENLSGTQMVRAPKWQTSFGFEYNVDVGGDYTLTFTDNNQYSSRFPTFLAVGRPGNDNWQGGYAKIDLSAQLTTPDDRWEFAIIGDDVNNKIVAAECANGNFGGEILGGEVTGGTGVGPAGIDGVACFLDPGRETWLRVTYRPPVSW